MLQAYSKCTGNLTIATLEMCGQRCRMRFIGLAIVPLVVAAACSPSHDSTPPTSTGPAACIDQRGSGWLDCTGEHVSCCEPQDEYCLGHDVANGCATGAWLGATLMCDCGWSDCDNDPSNGCETQVATNTNCGACGIHAIGACGVDGPSAQTELLFPSGYQPQGLAVDDQNVYWMSDGVLTSAPKAGGATTVLAQGESSWDATLAVSNGHVYWPWLTGEIHRIATSGGAVEVLASGIGEIVSNIVAHDDTAFVIVARGNGGELVDSLGHDLLPTIGATGSLALQNDILYVADQQSLYSIHVDGTAMTNIAAVTGQVAVNATSVFVVSEDSVHIFTNGSAQSTTASLAPSVYVHAIIATDTTLYVAADGYVPGSEAGWFESPSVLFYGSVDPTTGVTTALAPRARPGGLYGGFLFGSDGLSQFAVDSTYLYFMTFASDCAPGNVYRLAL